MAFIITRYGGIYPVILNCLSCFCQVKANEAFSLKTRANLVKLV